MALSAFDDKSKPLQKDELAATLGKTFGWWSELHKLIAARFAPLSIDWGLGEAQGHRRG